MNEEALCCYQTCQLIALRRGPVNPRNLPLHHCRNSAQHNLHPPGCYHPRSAALQEGPAAVPPAPLPQPPPLLPCHPATSAPAGGATAPQTQGTATAACRSCTGVACEQGMAAPGVGVQVGWQLGNRPKHCCQPQICAAHGAGPSYSCRASGKGCFSPETLQAGGLLQPGKLLRRHAKVTLSPGAILLPITHPSRARPRSKATSLKRITLSCRRCSKLKAFANCSAKRSRVVPSRSAWLYMLLWGKGTYMLLCGMGSGLWGWACRRTSGAGTRAACTYALRTCLHPSITHVPPWEHKHAQVHRLPCTQRPAQLLDGIPEQHMLLSCLILQHLCRTAGSLPQP